MRAFCRSRSFDAAWFPGITAQDINRYNVLEAAYLYEGAEALLGAEAQRYMQRYKFYIEPATDDRPFYFHFFRWTTLPEVFALRRAGGAGLIEWGYLILAATLMQALVAGLLLILLPLSRVEKEWPTGTGLPMGSYFLLLGLAFLFIEIAFIQKFILFLSHPLYSVAVVLSSFLVFAGLGSAWSDALSRKLAQGSFSPVTVVASAIGGLSILYAVLLPYLFQRFIGAPDVLKIGITNLLIAPLAFAMGMPFPLGLKHLANAAPKFIPWAWGINGFASVVSAVLATLLAIEFGFTAVILLAIALYALAAFLMSRSTRSRA